MNEVEKDLMQSKQNIEIKNEEVIVEEKVEAVSAEKSEMEESSSEEKKTETMQIMIHPIPQVVRKAFEMMMNDLFVIQSEIENKQNLANDQNRVIGERITSLVKEYDIEVNRSHYEHFVKSIATYMQLLHDIGREFRDEIILCHHVASLEEPKLYDMPVNIDLESYKWFLGHDALTEEEKQTLLLGKIQQVKRHIKTVKKDLRVSFSRYLYGFDAQMKQVERIELSMKQVEIKNRQMQAKQVKAESSVTN